MSTSPQCGLDMSTNNLLLPGSSYLPRPLSNQPYNYLAYQEFYVFLPSLAALNTTEMPFFPALNIGYNPEVPCPPPAEGATRCQPCPTLSRASAPYGCYCPVKIKARVRAARGWTPAANEKRVDRCGLPAAAWQEPGTFATPFNLYPNAPLPTPAEGAKFAVQFFSTGFGSNDCFTFHHGDVAAAHPDLNIIALDMEFQPDDVYTPVNTPSQHQAMANRVQVMRLAFNALIQGCQSGQAEFAEWRGLLDATPRLIPAGWSLGGETVILNRIGSPNASISTWANCVSSGACSGQLVLDMPFDATASAIDQPLLSTYEGTAFSFGSQSLRPIQSFPLFYTNKELFLNYLAVLDGTIHDGSGAESGLTLYTVMQRLGLSTAAFDADYTYANATTVMGNSLRNSLWLESAAHACLVFGLQQYCPYLLTCNARFMSGVDFRHCPVATEYETFDNVYAMLKSGSVGGQSSSSSAAGAISSVEYHDGFIARPSLCVAGAPPSFQELEELGFISQENNGYFEQRLCLAPR